MKILIFYIIIILTFIGCKNTYINWQEGVAYSFVSRNANYLRVDNTTKVYTTIPGVPEGIPNTSMRRVGISSNEECLSSNFFLMISINNLSPLQMSNIMNLPNYLIDIDSDYFDPVLFCAYKLIGGREKDEDDMKIINLIKLKYKISEVTKTIMIVETYSTSIITGLKIICDKKLFGKEPGEELNGFIAFNALNHDFIISQNYQMVASSNAEVDNLSINQYLSFRPFIAPATFLKFKSVPTELPLEVCFTVEMEIDGVKKLSHTGKKVKLI